MGTDIHMKLMHKNGTVVCENLYDGRNYEWFDNLQGRGDDVCYEHLSINSGLPKNCPENIEKLKEFYYYGFHYINLGEYMTWFKIYSPQKDAGWISTYKDWLIDNKGLVPEPGEDYKYYLDANDNINDYIFREFINERDPNLNVIEKINKILPSEENISDYFIYYYFDN